MSRIGDFVFQHVLDNPELVDADIAREAQRMVERGDQVYQILSLFMVSPPEDWMTAEIAWDVVRKIHSRIRRGVQVKEKGLVPGVKVRWGSEVYTIRAIGQDGKVYFQEKLGGHHPAAVVLS